MNFYQTFTTISELRPTWGSFVWIVFAFSIIFCAWKQGKGDLTLRILSVLISLALISSLPLLDFKLGGMQFSHPWARLVVFFLLFVIFTLFVGKTSLSLVAKTQGTFINRAILAIVFSGLFVSVLLSLAPEEIKKELGQWVSLAFIGQPVEFIWIMASIIFILLIG